MANSRKYNAVGSGTKPKLGKKSFTKGLARPGSSSSHAERVTAGAGSVSSVNGKIARPGRGHTERTLPSAKGGSVARPGWHEKIK